MTLSRSPPWGPEAKAQRGFLSAPPENKQENGDVVYNLLSCCQGRTVPHHVERAGDAGEDARRQHGQAPAGAGLHHRLQEQTPRGGRAQEEGEEEGGQGREDREKRQQRGRGEELAGLREVGRVPMWSI